MAQAWLTFDEDGQCEKGITHKAIGASGGISANNAHPWESPRRPRMRHSGTIHAASIRMRISQCNSDIPFITPPSQSLLSLAW